MPLKPVGDHVIVKPLIEDEVTKSGIVLPDTVEKERPEKGEVVAVGWRWRMPSHAPNPMAAPARMMRPAVIGASLPASSSRARQRTPARRRARSRRPWSTLRPSPFGLPPALHQQDRPREPSSGAGEHPSDRWSTPVPACRPAQRGDLCRHGDRGSADRLASRPGHVGAACRRGFLWRAS